MGRIGFLLRRSRVAGQKHGVTLTHQGRDNGTGDILLRVSKVGAVSKRIEQFASHSQIAHFAIGVASLGDQFHRTVLNLSLHGCVSHRVEHDHTMSDTVINHFGGADIHIGGCPYMVGIASGVDALGGGVVVRIAYGPGSLVTDRYAGLLDGANLYLLTGESTGSARCCHHAGDTGVVGTMRDVDAQTKIPV